MRSSSDRARARRVLTLALTLTAGLAATSLTATHGAASSASSSSPTVTAQPNSSLSDGQYLTVSFKGFTGGEAFDFRQCTPAPTDITTNCTALLEINHTPITAILENNGKGSTYVPVYSGSDPLLENAGATGAITCDVAHPCLVAAMPDPLDLASAALVPITFGASPDLCPPPGANEIVGSGSATGYRPMYQWEAAVCRPPTSISMSYTLKNSPDGVLNFLTGLTQFGVTGPWAPTYVPTSATSPPQTWDYAPIAMSGVVVAYRMYDLRGPQITGLTLTPDEIAEIFNGSLNNLATDPGVVALNPGILFPGQLSTFVRAEHSAESWVFSSWLAHNAATVWTYGGEEIFPAPFGVIAATGSAAVGFDVLSNPNQTFAGQGTIGFMDSTTAAYYGLPTVKIANADGSVTAATPATIATAVSEATVNADGTVTPGAADTAAWPMLMPTYMMVPTNNVTPATGTAIANLLRYAVQSGQSNIPTGDVPLTAAMVTASLAAAAAIPVTVPPPPPIALPPAPVTAPFVPSPPLTATSLPASTPAAAAAAPVPATSLRTAAVASAPLLLATDASHMLLPAALAVAALSVVAGVLLEAFGRLRRRAARARGPAQGPPS